MVLDRIMGKVHSTTPEVNVNVNSPPTVILSLEDKPPVLDTIDVEGVSD